VNTLNNRFSVVLISGIMAVVATALFFVVPVTLTFIIAYLFMLVAIAMFCFGNLYMLYNAKSYPWFAAFPLTIWRYLLAQLALSAIFVIRESILPGRFPIGLFLFLHIAALAFYVVLLTLLKGGKEIIEDRGAHAEAKVLTLRMMQTDVESIIRQCPEHEKPMKQVADALRYSDPMNHADLWVYNERIRENISAMSKLGGDDKIKIPKICETLLRQIADRNDMIKTMK